MQRLTRAGCHPVRADKASGKSREGRDELAALMDSLCDGDELVVVKLDRLGRSTRDVLNIVHELSTKGASLTVLEPPFSTRDQMGALLITVLGMVAEMERGFILERQKAGIDAARARGIYNGRTARVPMDRLRALHEAGIGPTAIGKELGISRVHVHRILTREQAGESGTSEILPKGTATSCPYGLNVRSVTESGEQP